MSVWGTLKTPPASPGRTWPPNGFLVHLEQKRKLPARAIILKYLAKHAANLMYEMGGRPWSYIFVHLTF